MQDVTQLDEARIRLPNGRELARPPGVQDGVSQFVQMTWLFTTDPQRLTPGAVRILQLRRRADLTKAKTELGYQPTSIRSAFEEAYDFHARRGAIKAPNPRRIRDVPGSHGASGSDALYSDVRGGAEGGSSNGHMHKDMPSGGCPVAH